MKSYFEKNVTMSASQQKSHPIACFVPVFKQTEIFMTYDYLAKVFLCMYKRYSFIYANRH